MSISRLLLTATVALLVLIPAAMAAPGGNPGNSAATMTVVFNDDGSAVYIGSKGLSHYIITDCEGNTTKIEMSGDYRIWLIASDDEIASITTKAGTSVATFENDGSCGEEPPCENWYYDIDGNVVCKD